MEWNRSQWLLVLESSLQYPRPQPMPREATFSTSVRPAFRFRVPRILWCLESHFKPSTIPCSSHRTSPSRLRIQTWYPPLKAIQIMPSLCKTRVWHTKSKSLATSRQLPDLNTRECRHISSTKNPGHYSKGLITLSLVTPAKWPIQRPL